MKIDPNLAIQLLITLVKLYMRTRTVLDDKTQKEVEQILQKATEQMLEQPDLEEG